MLADRITAPKLIFGFDSAEHFFLFAAEGFVGISGLLIFDASS
jgi:hypothetical protein